MPRKAAKKPAKPRKPRKPEQVLLLETQLDYALESPRSQVPFMRALFSNFTGMELIAKEVHSRSDLIKFLDYARKNKQIHAVHLVAHGKAYRKKTSLVLTHYEALDLSTPANQALFANLRVESLFLSSCELGAEPALMRRLREKSKVDAIFSYTREVDDYEAFLIESLFYHLAYGYVRGQRSRLSLKEVYERLKFSLDYLGIDSSEFPLSHPLLAAVFAK